MIDPTRVLLALGSPWSEVLTAAQLEESIGKALIFLGVYGRCFGGLKQNGMLFDMKYCRKTGTNLYWYLYFVVFVVAAVVVKSVVFNDPLRHSTSNGGVYLFRGSNFPEVSLGPQTTEPAGLDLEDSSTAWNHSGSNFGPTVISKKVFD